MDRCGGRLEVFQGKEGRSVQFRAGGRDERRGAVWLSGGICHGGFLGGFGIHMTMVSLPVSHAGQRRQGVDGGEG